MTELDEKIKSVGWSRKTVLLEYNLRFKDDKMNYDAIHFVLNEGAGKLSQVRRSRITDILNEREAEIRLKESY